MTPLLKFTNRFSRALSRHCEEGIARRSNPLIIGICLLLISAITGLVGCDHKHKKTQQYMEKIRQHSRIKRPITPPHYQTHPYRYTAAQTRNPFSLPNNSRASSNDSNDTNPSHTSKLARLTDYPLSELRCVGVISNAKKRWALIKAPDGKLHRIEQGEQLGREHAVVNQITQNGVKLIQSKVNARDTQDAITLPISRDGKES